MYIFPGCIYECAVWVRAHFEPRLIDGGVVGVLKERMNEVKKNLSWKFHTHQGRESESMNNMFCYSDLVKRLKAGVKKKTDL